MHVFTSEEAYDWWITFKYSLKKYTDLQKKEWLLLNSRTLSELLQGYQLILPTISAHHQPVVF